MPLYSYIYTTCLVIFIGKEKLKETSSVIPWKQVEKFILHVNSYSYKVKKSTRLKMLWCMMQDNEPKA